MSTCACCKAEERAFLFHPELGQHAFYLPGHHIRGFIALPVGETCKERLLAGETLTVTYCKKEFWVTLDGLKVIPAETEGERA